MEVASRFVLNTKRPARSAPGFNSWEETWPGMLPAPAPNACRRQLQQLSASRALLKGEKRGSKALWPREQSPEARCDRRRHDQEGEKRPVLNMHTPCTRHAHAMHTPCTRHAHAMLTPCTCHASTMRMRVPCVCRLRDQAAGRVPRASRAAALLAALRPASRRARRPVRPVEEVVRPRPADPLDARADEVHPPRLGARRDVRAHIQHAVQRLVV